MVDEGVTLPRLKLGSSLVAVAVGGAVGTWIRAEILTWQPTPPTLSLDGTRAASTATWQSFVPWWLLVINTVGVLVAALLLAGPLKGRSPDDPWRLFALTGALGGLTSYSALIRDFAVIRSMSPLGAGVTLLGAIAAGIVAAWFGVVLARLRWP